MHPNPAFQWDDPAELRAFVRARGFATLCFAGAEGPMIAHAPVIVTDTGDLRFHLARSNRVARHVEGLATIASVIDTDHYVSPDWYGSVDQVPTWNYRAVEIEGHVRALDDTALVDQLDTLSATFETMLAPKPAWTRAKMTPGRFEAMTHAIRGFELVASAWRGTAKFAQHKSAAERIALADALAATGRADAAALVRPA
ncbi:MAG TPA: FMN-binding negative transcriptional regulator [Sphingomonas sp.]